MRIELRAVSVSYDEGLPTETVALRGVDIAVGEGECVAVLGPTGSGKTTLLEVMAGLTHPASGTVSVAEGPDGLGPRDLVGLAYQFPELQFFEETVLEDVSFGPRRQGLSDEEVRSRARDALVRSGLEPEEFADRAPLSLSAGEKRRAGIAGILALDRPFLLLDEPTAGLDPAAADLIAQTVSGEKSAGRGVVVVSHDLEFVDRVAGRTVVMGEGRLLEDASTEEVLGDAMLLERLSLAPPARYALLERLRTVSPGEVDRVALILGRGGTRDQASD